MCVCVCSVFYTDTTYSTHTSFSSKVNASLLCRHQTEWLENTMNVPRATRLEFIIDVFILPTLRNTPFREEREICGRDVGIQPSVGLTHCPYCKSFFIIYLCWWFSQCFRVCRRTCTHRLLDSLHLVKNQLEKINKQTKSHLNQSKYVCCS